MLLGSISTKTLLILQRGGLTSQTGHYPTSDRDTPSLPKAPVSRAADSVIASPSHILHLYLAITDGLWRVIDT